VVDGIDRLVISDQHYGPLADVDDDVLLLEWDIAAGQEQLIRFAQAARIDPGRVLVAPYRIYPAGVWAHRRWDGTGTGTVSPVGASPIATGDPVCNLFGFGMTYLPRGLPRQFTESGWSAHFGDVPFSMWHHQHVTPVVPICWDVRPVHLNYQIPKEFQRWPKISLIN
jgi:hypothetical protein